MESGVRRCSRCRASISFRRAVTGALSRRFSKAPTTGALITEADESKNASASPSKPSAGAGSNSGGSAAGSGGRPSSRSIAGSSRGGRRSGRRGRGKARRQSLAFLPQGELTEQVVWGLGDPRPIRIRVSATTTVLEACVLIRKKVRAAAWASCYAVPGGCVLVECAGVHAARVCTSWCVVVCRLAVAHASLASRTHQVGLHNDGDFGLFDWTDSYCRKLDDNAVLADHVKSWPSGSEELDSRSTCHTALHSPASMAQQHSAIPCFRPPPACVSQVVDGGVWGSRARGRQLHATGQSRLRRASLVVLRCTVPCMPPCLLFGCPLLADMPC